MPGLRHVAFADARKRDAMTESHNPPAAIARVDTPQGLSPMAAAVLAKNPDTETLRELMAMEKEWHERAAERAFHVAKAGLMRDMPTVIHRDKVVDFKTSRGRTNYTHSSLAAIVEAITDPLTAHGFTIGYRSKMDDKGQVLVTCILTHCEGHSEATTLPAQPDTSGNKNPAQALASAVTLLRRYTLTLLLGIATADMDEPTGKPEPQPDAVDVDKNIRTVAAIVKRGKTKDQAEDFTGRPVAEWTGEDRRKLDAWSRPEPEAMAPDKVADIDAHLPREDK